MLLHAAPICCQSGVVVRLFRLIQSKKNPEVLRVRLSVDDSGAEARARAAVVSTKASRSAMVHCAEHHHRSMICRR